MGKRGRRVVFHGAYASKKAAIRKERSRRHAYVRRVRIKGKQRWLVLTRRKRK